ncbi:MAG: hypothetical protein IJP86_05825 [Synergistaceae bacterium]|nr:hypothetical protein [Synergistaceae bacterium]
MKLDNNAIISDVKKWLKGTGVEVSLYDSRGRNNESGHEILMLELGGEPVKDLAGKYGVDGRLILRWIMPRREGGNCTVTDFLSGDHYSSGYIFRRPEFDRGRHDDIAPLHLCPDLGKGSVFHAWYRDIQRKWTSFAANIKGKCYLDNFIRLEAGLNAIFTSASARNAGRFIKQPSDDTNPLLALETPRQVLIDWPSETLGRLRIPHSSHENKLCPFQTPESKRIGLQLHLSAGSKVEDGKITEGDGLFSVACGLIPYPHHTDGPRLMMGGKNMKQAETGITGAEPPIVPGYYEGDYSSDIEILRSNMRDKRFFPRLGLNALTVIMPFKGYTYEDGLVISESLASRLCIKEGSYSISRTFEAVIRESELREKGISIDDVFTFNPGDKYVYGDDLPKPTVNLYSTDNPDKAEIWHKIYDHHAPGISRGITVRSIVRKVSGPKNDKQYHTEFIVSWNFIVERPMSLGDKLTGRNGNKGVVTKILPDEEMPAVHFADGSLPAELIISPCSIIGRKNLGQIWEMTHSLLIMKGGQKLHGLLDETGLDISSIRLDGINDHMNADNIKRITDRLCEFLAETGCDEWGTFDVSFDGEHVRAFAGWQYFCRLHHHAWKKLQARGIRAPYDSYNGQPVRCGALTGQRLGEMENWAFLSHGANSVLYDMRLKQTGDYGKTRNLFRKILRSLGIVMSENESGLNFSPRQNDDDGLKRKSLRNSLGSASETLPFCGIITTGKSPRDLAADTLGKISENQTSPRVMKAAKELSGIISGECFFNPDGSIHVEPEILSCSAELGYGIQEYGSLMPDKSPPLKKLLLRFCTDKNPLGRAEALISYRDGLVKILSGKTGIPRCYMSGRRYNHSGRAVIVPEPSLDVDCVYLPAAMLVEILEGYDDSYVSRIPHSLRDFHGLRRIFSDCHSRRHEAHELAERLDDFLMSECGELWCFLIRQPSLHRHSVQAFRARCWEFPVIGLPPFVTPGFNADFDGDTMAVFIPPYEHAKDLSRYSILSSPGLIGSGKIAFADSLDLALGWWNMQNGEKRVKLSRHLQDILRETPRDELRGILRKLQADIAERSSGAATLTPIEFERLSADMSDNNFAHGLNVLIDSGAKGSLDDVKKIVKELGSIDVMQDTDPEKTKEESIKGCFWRGLSDEELFRYSYPSRFSMAQKKLSVAEAGYLSRLLAEKLYEYTVSVHDCGTSEGLEVSYSHEADRLIVDGEILPTLGNTHDDARRVLWGRVVLGETDCLDSDGVERVLQSLKEGGKVIVRSPLHCHERKNGHVCALCYGADAASMPYDKPEPATEGFSAGLTAAEAIGERGTQLAMKRFHDSSSKAESPIKAIRKILAGKKAVPISDVIAEILTADIENHTANKELPQSLIHFETAASCSRNDGGEYISDISGEKIARLLVRKQGDDFRFSDSLRTTKSRLLWEGGENHNVRDFHE